MEEPAAPGPSGEKTSPRRKRSNTVAKGRIHWLSRRPRTRLTQTRRPGNRQRRQQRRRQKRRQSGSGAKKLAAPRAAALGRPDRPDRRGSGRQPLWRLLRLLRSEALRVTNPELEAMYGLLLYHRYLPELRYLPDLPICTHSIEVTGGFLGASVVLLLSIPSSRSLVFTGTYTHRTERLRRLSWPPTAGRCRLGTTPHPSGSSWVGGRACSVIGNSCQAVPLDFPEAAIFGHDLELFDEKGQSRGIRGIGYFISFSSPCRRSVECSQGHDLVAGVPCRAVVAACLISCLGALWNQGSTPRGSGIVRPTL